MPSVVNAEAADDVWWKHHNVKRRRTSLTSELLETQASSMKRLFNGGNGKFADVTISCGRTTLKAHACILASRCNFFQAGLENFKEGETKQFWMDDDDPKVLSHFLEYLYTQAGYSVIRCFLTGPIHHRMRRLLDLCRVADKYDQPLLLEQIHKFFHNQSSGKDQFMSVEDLMLAYKEFREMIDSAWLSRIREAVLGSLLKPENLKNLTAQCKIMLEEDSALACSLIELLADRCDTLTTKLTETEDRILMIDSD